ncbi:MAG: serine/threonine protein kinase [Treponema sp.]|nr:serine/threonine protein kinase [Treponema sp.]
MPVVPEYIGKYRIASVVAVGGMGTVYKAVHPSLKREVIIKKLTLRNGGSITRERFKREARILLEFSSPYIVRMFDYFTEGKSDYIVLEFVDGMSLDKLIKKFKVLTPELSALIFLDSCLGLKAAHSKEIVHRDIKPGNILISRRAEVKLADFGIASSEKENEASGKEDEATVVQEDFREGITVAGSTLGTPAYMSPEQFDDSSSVDHRADIYSMGVTLYEMVTGQKPYSGDMSKSNLAKIKRGSYVSPKKLSPALPKEITSLIKKMMKPRASSRFRNIDAVIKKVRHFLRKYDTHSLRVLLAKAVLAKEGAVLPVIKPKRNIAARIFSVLLLAASLAGGFFFCWKHGYVHATVLSKWYSPVVLNLKLPATSGVDADLPSRAFFFSDDGSKIPEVPGTRRVFEVSGDDGSNLLSTKPVYLKDGDYRVKVASGPCVWWKDFNVSGKKVLLKVNLQNSEMRPLSVDFNVFDSKTLKPVSSRAELFVMSGKNWIPLDEETASKLRTGSVHKFKISAEGYADKFFSLLIDWYQDRLVINASMNRSE